MPADNILVIAVDGLRASALGAYGNTSYATPALDHLAAESFLLDASFADAAELPAIYRALWQSAHPLRDEKAVGDAPSLPRLLATHGYVTTLVTDEPAVATQGMAAAFKECVELPRSSPVRSAEVSHTALAQLFDAAWEQISSAFRPGDSAASAGVPRFVWMHSRGMYGPWDAPLELQELLLARDEGDPSPRDMLEPPSLVLDDAYGPDAAFAWSCAYAAQVMVLDGCMERLCHALGELPSAGSDFGELSRVASSPRADSWLVVLLGVRGLPLGEHGRIGGVDSRLFAEQLHVPMLWRFPDGTGRLARSGQLASHLDVTPTLLDWVADGTTIPPPLSGSSLLSLARDSATDWRDALVAAGTDGVRSIRTAQWSLRREVNCAGVSTERDSRAQSGTDAQRHELYVRPDDRWEANDVAGLCPEIVQQLSHQIDEAAEFLAGGGTSTEPPSSC